MKIWITIGLVISFIGTLPVANARSNAEIKTDWESLELGMYIHFGLGTFIDPGTPINKVKVSDFRPKDVDVRQWVKAAKAIDAKYVCLVVKHENGFCLWDSRDYEYDIGSSPARKQDILFDLIEACKAEGIKVGIHYSINDWYNEGGYLKKGVISRPYFEVIKQHTEELHLSYPGITIHLFDWAQRLSPAQYRELNELVEDLNPECIVHTRGKNMNGPVLKERFITIPRTKNWMWQPEYKLTEVDSIYRVYATARKNGANFIVGVGPDRNGKIPPDQLRVLGKLKQMIDENPTIVPSPKNTNSSSSNPGQNSQEQLKKLKSLYDDGLISKEIYEEKQKELVDALLSGNAESPSAIQNSVNLKKGLVLYFGFNESSNFKVKDGSGLGNDGKVRGAKWTKDGRSGGAYHFDQKKRTHGIRVEDSDSLDCTSVTIAAWIKTDDEGSGWTRILDKDWEQGYNLCMGGTLKKGSPNPNRCHGKCLFEFSNKRSLVAKKTVTDGTWHHIVSSFDGNRARIYIDGVLDSERKLKNPGPIKINDIDLVIGNKNPEHEKEEQTNAFDGLIDEVRIYNRVLNNNEVAALFKLN